MSENYISANFHNYWRERRKKRRQTPQKERQQHILHYSHLHHYCLWSVSNRHEYFPFPEDLKGLGRKLWKIYPDHILTPIILSWPHLDTNHKYLILRYLRYQTHSHLLNHLRNLTSWNYPIDSVYVCVCVCVCVCVGGWVHACVCACMRVCACVCICACVCMCVFMFVEVCSDCFALALWWAMCPNLEKQNIEEYIIIIIIC